MKNRFLMVLPLAASLMVPAVAQQQTSQDQNQNAQPQQQQAQSADQSRQPLTYERHEGFWGKINPFARKKYVQRQLDPVRGRVNELDELTAKNSKDIKDVDSRAQQGIQMANNKAMEADQHAVDAGNRAQAAQQTATQASTRLNTVEQVVGNIDQYQPATQAEIRFRSGQTALSAKAKEALDEIADGVKGKNGYIIQVEGFAPNTTASSNMAQSVVRYLVVKHDIPVYRIHNIGMGKVRRASAENKSAKGSRVEVTVLKNGIDQLASNNMGSAAPASQGQGGMSGTTTANPTPNPNQQNQRQANPNDNRQQPSTNTQEPPHSY